MTKMAAMPIYGKNTLKFSSLKPEGQCPSNLVYSIRVSGPTKFIQMMIGLDLLYTKITFAPWCFYMEKCLNIRYFTETIEVCEWKVGTNSWLSEYMTTYYEHQRSRSFFDLFQWHSDLYFQTYSQAAGLTKI